MRKSVVLNGQACPEGFCGVGTPQAEGQESIRPPTGLSKEYSSV